MMRTIKNVIGFAKRQTKLILGVSAGLAVGGVASAAVMAAVPGDDGTIHGCYRTSGLLANGQLRLIDDTTESCNNNETAISWSQSSAGGGNAFVDNLVGADFSGADLRYRNLAGLNISNGIFTEANLTGSDFSSADLSGTTLNGAKISGANFNGTTFSNVNFESTKAFDSNFQGATFAGAAFTGGFENEPDFSGSTFQGANFSGATVASFVKGGDYRGSDFSNITFHGTEGPSGFTHANLSGLDFTSATFQFNVWLFHSDLTNVNFNGVDLESTSFVQVNLSGANFSNGIIHDEVSFSDSILDGTDFSNASFDRISFAGSNLSTANLAGVTWSNVTCPDGTNSDNNGNTCLGHLVPPEEE